MTLLWNQGNICDLSNNIQNLRLYKVSYYDYNIIFYIANPYSIIFYSIVAF